MLEIIIIGIYLLISFVCMCLVYNTDAYRGLSTFHVLLLLLLFPLLLIRELFIKK